MTSRPAPYQKPTESNSPLGMSKFSIRRYSVQHVILLFLVLSLITAMNVYALREGETLLMALAAVTLFLALAMSGLTIFTGVRTVAIEIWIRRLGMGDFEYRIEPWGNDEVSKACEALDTLRQSSIRALQLDRVQQLSDELRDKNDELEQALANLRRTQDQIISQQKLAELGELSSGVAHEMRNPLQFVQNFASSSIDIALELKEMIQQPDKLAEEDAEELIKDLSDNMERVLHHSNRANGIVSAMLTLDRGAAGGFRPVDLNKLVADQTNLAHRAVQVHDSDFFAEIIMELDSRLEEVIVVPEDVARVISQFGIQCLSGDVVQGQGKRKRLRLPARTESRYSQHGRRRHDTGPRQRDGYDTGGKGKDVQSILHYQGEHKKYRSGIEPRLRCDQGARRQYQGGFGARKAY